MSITAKIKPQGRISASTVLVGQIARLNDLNDVNTSGILNGYILVYDSTTQTFIASSNKSPTITLSGDLTGSVTLTNLESGTLNATIAPNSVALGTDTTGNYVATITGTTNQVNVSGSGSETAAVTLSLPQSIATTSSPTFAGASVGSLNLGDIQFGSRISGSGNIYIESTSSTYNDIRIGTAGTVYIQGNLDIQGTINSIHSTSVTIDDPIVILGSADVVDTYDRGIAFKYRTSSPNLSREGFFGWDRSENAFTFLITNPQDDQGDGIINGTILGNARFGQLNLQNTQLISGTNNSITVTLPSVSGTLATEGYIPAIDLDEIDNVYAPSPTNGQVLKWVSLNSRWESGAVSGNGSDLTSLNATELTSGTMPVARMPALTGGDATTSAGSGTITLAATGTAGTYRSVTTDSKGRVTAGTNPTTIAGYGLTDAVSNTLTLTAAGLVTGGGTLAANRTFTVTAATSAETITGTATNTAVTPVGNRAALVSYVEPIATTRDQSSYGQSDGSTSGRGIVYPGSDRTLLTSAAAFEFVAEVLFPTTTANENRGILTVGNTSVNATTGGFTLVSFSGTLFFNLGTNGGQWQASGYVLNNAGIRKRLHVSIPCGTQSAPTVTDETGATVTFTQSIAPSGADTWLGSTLANRAFVVGAGWPAGEIPRVIPILGTLSTAEKTAYRTTGRLPAWVMAGGSAVSLYSSDFSAGLNGWSTGSGTLDFNQDGVTDGTTSKDNCLRFYANASNVAHGAILSLPAAVAGRRIRVSGEYYIPAGQTAVNGIEFQTTGVSATPHLSAVGVWSTFSAESISGGPILNLYLKSGVTGYIFVGANSATDDRAFVRNIVVTQLGAVTFPAYQRIGTVRDLTARGVSDSSQGRLVGVTPIITSAQCGSVIKIPAQAFTAATSVQILGGAITGENKQRIVSITGNSSASTTLSVGTSSGGTNLVLTQAVNGDFDIGTFASRFLAANSSIWLTFAANTTAYVTINTSDL
jgi:hypothetical protein